MPLYNWELKRVFMPFCCSDGSVIKWLSAVAGCHPGGPSSISSSVAGCSLRLHRDPSGTEGVQGSQGSAVSCTLSKPNSFLHCPALRHSPGAGSEGSFVNFKYKRHCAKSQTHISQPQAGLGHYTLYNHQQLFLCWLGLNLHGRKWKEKD